MNRRYYEEELRYLREAGKAFAQAHPEEAAHLNVDSVSDRDPYVERLFEGFAFLTGRVHERLDDELPQYTEGLLQLLYPHFLKPIPSLSVVALNPKPGLVQETTRMGAGIEVRSNPVGPEDAVCRFTTTAPVDLQPVRLTDASLHWTTDDTSRARLRFELERGVKMSDLDRERLRLYFHADAPLASTMHLFFTRHLRGLSATCGDAGVDLRGQKWVQPAGFGDDEGLLPYGPRSFSGFRLLQEYLCFRRKFWFVDVFGLDRLPDDADASTFEVELHFDRPYPEDKRFRVDNLRLHCVPVINLFEMDAEPIRVEGLVSEYRVTPSVRLRQSLETYDVQAVTGIEDETGRRHAYTPFYTFRHAASRSSRGSREHVQKRYFTTTRRIGPNDTPEVYLSLGGTELETLADAPAETLSVEIRATNGSLPREHLQEGMLSELAPDVPQIVRPENLTRPTLIRDPSGRDDFYWDLLSHLSFNLASVATREALVEVLELYDWTGTDVGRANRRRIDGIRDVSWEPKEVMRRGAVMRGAEVTLEVQHGHFANEGDLCLFGEVLSRFLSLYATINSFVHLTLVLNPSGRRYQWTPTRGSQSML